MRSFNVILCVSLVILSFSNAFDFNSLSEIKQLRASTYGNSLIETISLTLQNAGNVKEVQKLLNDLEFKLNDDQKRADDAWEELKKQIDIKIAELKSQIAKVTRQITDEKQALEALQLKISQGKENLIEYNKQKTFNLNALSQNEEKRRLDHLQHQKAVTEHNTVIDALQQVIAELKNLVGSISGQGKPVHVEEIAAETRDRLAKSFAQVSKEDAEVQLFVEMATSADQDALGKLIKLLEDLTEKTKESLNADNKFEQDSEKSYENLKSLLRGDIEALDARIKEQTSNLATYENQEQELKVSIAKNEELLKVLTQDLAETERYIAQKLAQYEAEKKQRAEELAVVLKLKEIVEKRLANMSNFLGEKQ